MQEGWQPRSGVVEMPACRPKDTVENAEATRRRTVTVEHGCNATLESLLENEDSRRTETSRRSEPGPIVDIVYGTRTFFKKVFLL
jgi:hypothetical protein